MVGSIEIKVFFNISFSIRVMIQAKPLFFFSSHTPCGRSVCLYTPIIKKIYFLFAVVDFFFFSEGEDRIKREIRFSTFGIRKRKRQPTPVFLPRKSHRQRSLVGYSQQGRKELDMTEHTTLTLTFGIGGSS